ncbi:MAG: alpha/beta fold hydrolase [Hylemonella sp.]
MQRRSLPLDAGGGLALREYAPAGVPKASVVIGGAMGVPQGFYAAFAQWLAGQGYRVVTFDYRGHGESLPDTPGHTLRGYRADLFDWAGDYETVVRTVRQEQPEQPLYLLGHSLGAQLPGLFQQPGQVDGLLSVAAGSGYWRDNAPQLRRRVLFLWYVMAPLATRAWGYFPGRRLGMVGDLPAGVIRQWRRWCLHPRYSAGAEGAVIAERYAQVRFPVLAWSFSDDELMTLRGTHNLFKLYRNALRRVESLGPADASMRRIGHFGMFREQFRDTLWQRSIAALNSLAELGKSSVPSGTDPAEPLPQTSNP